MSQQAAPENERMSQIQSDEIHATPDSPAESYFLRVVRRPFARPRHPERGICHFLRWKHRQSRCRHRSERISSKSRVERSQDERRIWSSWSGICFWILRSAEWWVQMLLACRQFETEQNSAANGQMNLTIGNNRDQSREMTRRSFSGVHVIGIWLTPNSVKGELLVLFSATYGKPEGYWIWYINIWIFYSRVYHSDEYDGW